MNDIDFDELDKAVNSLVTKKSGGASVPQSPGQEKRPPESPASSAQPGKDKTPEPTKPTPIAVTPGRRSARLGPKPASHPGRGSFIDIMAPKPVAKKLSHTGQTIQPATKKTESVEVEPEPASEPEEPKFELTPPESKPVTPAPKPEPAESKKLQEELWPDPLDFSNEPVATSEAEKPQTEPVPSSPFIKDAKVEKRPLGAFTQYVAAADKDLDSKPQEEKQPETTPEPMSEPISEQPEAVPVDKPRREVVVGESNEKDESTQESAPAEEQAAEAPESEAAAEPERPSPQQLHDTAMLSIPKQYKTAEKPVDKATRPVFDTKEYHPPLLEETAHAAHRSSIWNRLFVTLLVIAVLAIGVYLAVIYFVQNF